MKKTEDSRSDIELNLSQSQKSNNSHMLQNMNDSSQIPIGETNANNITTEAQLKPPKAQLSGRINPKVMKKKSQNASNQQSFSKPGNKQFSKYTRSRQSEFSKDTHGIRINPNNVIEDLSSLQSEKQEGESEAASGAYLSNNQKEFQINQSIQASDNHSAS